MICCPNTEAGLINSFFTYYNRCEFKELILINFTVKVDVSQHAYKLL